MNNILITSAGQRVSLVRAFQKELKQLLPSGKVMTVDMMPGLSPACNVSDGYFQVKPVTGNDYIPELLQLCRERNIKMVVPTIDTELKILAENRMMFEKEGISIIVSDLEFVTQCRDKRLSNKFFQAHQIEIPSAIEKDAPTFPLFIKPFDGSLSVDTFLVKSADDLTDYHRGNDRLMFMEYMDKASHDEYTIDMYYGKDNLVKCIVPRKRIAVRAGEISKGLTQKNILVKTFKDKLGYINGARGCLTLQAFLNKETGRVVGIEINPRFGGGYPLSYGAGANYPRWLMQEYFLNEQISYKEDWEDDLLMLRYDDEVLIHDYRFKA